MNKLGKIQLMFKTPNAVSDAIDRYIEDSSERDDEVLYDIRSKLKQKLEGMFQYGEYATIEVDLDTNKVTVL